VRRAVAALDLITIAAVFALLVFVLGMHFPISY
jgi:hypothetical protein